MTLHSSQDVHVYLWTPLVSGTPCAHSSLRRTGYLNLVRNLAILPLTYTRIDSRSLS